MLLPQHSLSDPDLLTFIPGCKPSKDKVTQGGIGPTTFGHKSRLPTTEPQQLLPLLSFWVYWFLYCLGSSSLQKQKKGKRKGERQRTRKEQAGRGRKMKRKEKKRKKEGKKRKERKRKRNDVNAEWSMVNGPAKTIDHWLLKGMGKGREKAQEQEKERKES